jgi:hypothetical protein
MAYGCVVLQTAFPRAVVHDELPVRLNSTVSEKSESQMRLGQEVLLFPFFESTGSNL